MSPRDKRTSFTDDDGRRYRVAYTWHPSPLEAARVLVAVVEAESVWPAGYHFWTGRVQKDRNGRRASLQVVYQEDRKPRREDPAA